MRVTSAASITLLCAVSHSYVAVGQAPSTTVDPQRHGNLAAAQESIVQAYSRIGEAQRDNSWNLEGHAQRAKELLGQASSEIQAAADAADKNRQSSLNAVAVPSAPPAETTSEITPPVPASISGSWTIYAYNVSRPGSSLKYVQLSQSGNIISGTFHGPNQHGKLQGWINGNHVEFSTDTNEVLTFRGEVTAAGMSGMYGINGQHAPWKAERTN